MHAARSQSSEPVKVDPPGPTDARFPFADTAEAKALRERFASVRERIAAAARRAGREPDDVLVVAVSKHAHPEEIRELIRLGHVDFGENRVQQLIQRCAMVDEWLGRGRSMRQAGVTDGPAPPEGVRWHMIGRLQRNKVKKAVECARLIHSIDSMRVAEEVQNVALRREAPVEILLQVNCSGEQQKGGVSIAAAIHVATQIDTMLNVHLRGLMTMAAISDDPEDSRESFQRCRDLFEEIRREGVGEDHGRFNVLSMGMTGDFEVAIEEGANVVRIGSAIFGERSGPPDDEDDEGDDQ